MEAHNPLLCIRIVSLTILQATKRHLSSRIDRVDCSIDEFAELTASTKEEVGPT